MGLGILSLMLHTVTVEACAAHIRVTSAGLLHRALLQVSVADRLSELITRPSRPERANATRRMGASPSETLPVVHLSWWSGPKHSSAAQTGSRID